MVAYLTAALVVTIQRGVAVGHPGNFLLFRASFYRLIDGASLYYPPPDQMTGFLYSPTFALLFAPFAVWPVPVGLLLWNCTNATALYYGLTRLLPPPAARLALAIVFLDLLRSMQNSQSNALVAGLIVIGFLALEWRRESLAAAAILVGAVIKIFPLGAGVMGLFGPARWRFLRWSIAIGTGLAVAPLLVLSPAAYSASLREWVTVLQRDSGLQGQSVMRLLSDWFGLASPNWIVQLSGVGLLVSPALVGSLWSDRAFRLRFLSSLLVFLVIFNHESESASFVVATTGIAIWFVTTRRTWWRTMLLGLVVLAVSVPRLFFFPYQVYHDVIRPHALDAFPCIVVWVVMQVELWRWPRASRAEWTERDVAAGEAGPHGG